MPEENRIHVLVGLLQDAQGRWLVNQRRPGTHAAGRWEFPGGKREPGEPERQTLERELAEELGIVVVEAEPFMTLTHDYTDRRVLLEIWHVAAYEGEPRALESQRLRWVSAEELGAVGLLEADRPIVERIRARFG